jgi:hypothetical protein
MISNTGNDEISVINFGGLRRVTEDLGYKINIEGEHFWVERQFSSI